MSPYGTFPVERFGGLRLDLEAEEVGPSQAIDLLNVDLDKRGGVRTRDGLEKGNLIANAVNFAAIATGRGSTRVLLMGSDGKYSLWDGVTGVIVGAASGTAYSALYDAASFGTGTTNYL